MATDTKALLAMCKALSCTHTNPDNKAMLSTSQQIATKLQQFLRETGITPTAIANACSVSRQAVQGWKKTGRIDKMKFQRLVQFSERPMTWWLDSQEMEGTNEGMQQHVSDCAPAWKSSQGTPPYWPFKTVLWADFDRLPAEDKTQIEGHIKLLISLERQRKKTSYSPR